MNFILLACILWFNIFITTNGWTAIEQTDNNQSHEGYCFSSIKGVGALKKGEVKMKPNECVKVECREGGLMVHSGCDPVYKNCSTKTNKNAFYPECCSKIC